MSRSTTNIITKGYHGKVGDQFIIKSYGGMTVLSAIPTFTKPWSEKQIANRRKFGRAVKAAAALAKQPEIQEKYANKLKPRQNILNLMVSEKLKELSKKF